MKEIIEKAIQAIDATVRALSDAAKAAFRRALKSFKSFVSWLRKNLPEIHKVLEAAKLVLELFQIIRDRFF
jgi:ABC-type transporter Mla subunit MlaD